MFFTKRGSITKRGIDDKNDKNFSSNLTLYKLDLSTIIGIRTLGVNYAKIGINFSHESPTVTL